MTDEMKALAQRAVASKHWRWVLGMLDDQGQRVSRAPRRSAAVR
jgi:hypothetical protein